jgi:ketosteroid isomerase-like protein
VQGPWDSHGFYFDMERIEDRGETVVVLGRFRARGSRSGVDVAREWAHVVTFRNGDLQTRNYQSWDDALEAVGLRE